MPVNKQPQSISAQTWEAVKAACISGRGFSEASRAFGIRNAHTVIMRCRRESWPTPPRVHERAQQLQALLQRRSEAAERRRHVNDVTTEILAEDWVSRGERHRSLVYGLANAALNRLGKDPPRLETWGDVEKADRAGRRACGLDDAEATRNINVGMQLVNQRIEAAYLTLPKDACEKKNASELPESEPLQIGNP